MLDGLRTHPLLAVTAPIRAALTFAMGITAFAACSHTAATRAQRDERVASQSPTPDERPRRPETVAAASERLAPHDEEAPAPPPVQEPVRPTEGPRSPGPIVADHRAADAFDRIPERFITEAIARFRFLYGHTSHGSQIVTGLRVIRGQDPRFAFDMGLGSFRLSEQDGDLGDGTSLEWATATREVLGRPQTPINAVMWSWCGGVSSADENDIETYLRTMGELEAEFPETVFVYMTGHLDGSGSRGNLNRRNDQIRAHCREHGRVLFDFADIETYDPEGTHHPQDTDACAWCSSYCESHTCPSCPGDCAHSHCFGCYRKGRAFWWLLARLAGWEEAPEAGQPLAR